MLTDITHNLGTSKEAVAANEVSTYILRGNISVLPEFACFL